MLGVLLAVWLAGVISAAAAAHGVPGDEPPPFAQVTSGDARFGTVPAGMGPQGEALAERWRRQSSEPQPHLFVTLSAALLGLLTLRRRGHLDDVPPSSSSPLRRHLLALRGPPVLAGA